MASGFDLSLLNESDRADLRARCDSSGDDEGEDGGTFPADAPPATAAAAVTAAAAAAVHYRNLADFEPDFKRQVCSGTLSGGRRRASSSHASGLDVGLV